MTSQSTPYALALGGEDCSDRNRRRLERLRTDLNAGSGHGLSGARVVLYVKTLPDEDPAPHVGKLLAKARSRGWTVHKVIHDAEGGIEPSDGAWGELLEMLGSGSVRGVLVPSHQHISMDAWRYERALHEIAERRCFTSLLLPEPST